MSRTILFFGFAGTTALICVFFGVQPSEVVERSYWFGSALVTHWLITEVLA